jgi:hypothetical protein
MLDPKYTPDLRTTLTDARLAWAKTYRAAILGQELQRSGPDSFAYMLETATHALVVTECSLGTSLDHERLRLRWYRTLWDLLLSGGVESVSELLATGSDLLAAGWTLKDVLARVESCSTSEVMLLVATIS